MPPSAPSPVTLGEPLLRPFQLTPSPRHPPATNQVALASTFPRRLRHGDGEDWLGDPKSWGRAAVDHCGPGIVAPRDRSGTRIPTGTESRVSAPSRWSRVQIPASLTLSSPLRGRARGT